MTSVDGNPPAVVACPWCLAPVAIRGASGDPAAQFDPLLDDSGNLVGVRAWGHSCVGSDLYRRVLARASAS